MKTLIVRFVPIVAAVVIGGIGYVLLVFSPYLLIAMGFVYQEAQQEAAAEARRLQEQLETGYGKLFDGDEVMLITSSTRSASAPAERVATIKTKWTDANGQVGLSPGEHRSRAIGILGQAKQACAALRRTIAPDCRIISADAGPTSVWPSTLKIALNGASERNWISPRREMDRIRVVFREDGVGLDQAGSVSIYARIAEPCGLPAPTQENCTVEKLDAETLVWKDKSGTTQTRLRLHVDMSVDRKLLSLP